MKNNKAILFDYNGTLFFDADLNYSAWKETVKEITNNQIDFDEIYKEFKSVKNSIFVEKIFQKMNYDYDQEKILYWSKRKETEYYQKLCVASNRNKLSPGAIELLDYLKENNIPINLCTASIKENVDFYFDYLKLGRWFKKELVAYDDYTFKDKTDMYLAAAKRINKNIKDCIVIEDSLNSIYQAIKAGCENIIMINNDNDLNLKEIKQKINNFKELDYSILK